MFDTFAGLPLHAVVVHATVVLVPLAAVAVLLALWPRFRRWAGPLPALLSLVALALVPLSTQSGEALERRVGETQAVERHAELGESLLPWVAVLTLAALVLAWVWWRERSSRAGSATRGDSATRGASAREVPSSLGSVPGGRVAALGLVAVTLLAVGGAAVQVVRIGHSGAEAVWQDTVATTPSGGSEVEDEDD